MHSTRIGRTCKLAAAGIAAVASMATPAVAQQYKIERVLNQLQQPTYVTFAPGDNNTMYFMERTTVVGGSSTARMGRIAKYNPLTDSAPSTFLDLSGVSTSSVPNDSGSLCVTFHPDFQTNGKFYATMAYRPSGVTSGPVTNELREYTVVNGAVDTSTARTVLKYSNNDGTFHTIDWIGFKHAPPGSPERNHLYVTTGDGGPQAPTIDRPQRPDNVYGKVLRLDVTPGATDAYPGDVNKNFAIPSVNAIPGAPASRLGEVIATGLRNPFRASFDRANNDMYIGDVGLNLQEELNFIKNEAINPPSGSMTMYDFGWPTREGVVDGPLAGTGVKGSSLDPVLYRTRDTNDDGIGDRSITGGYVYRGPIAELQGKYIFADYISDNIYTLEFDRDTDPATFDGTNYDPGDFDVVTSDFQALVEGGFDLQRISSFGEDGDGNLYFVSLADDLFSAYTSTAEGAIYRLVLVPEPSSIALIALIGGSLLRPRRRPYRAPVHPSTTGGRCSARPHGGYATVCSPACSSWHASIASLRFCRAATTLS